jgi:type II secretory pathway predicted ATPase ExeA
MAGMGPVAASESRADQSADVRDPARFIAAIRHASITELVDGPMQGTRLLALTAPAGAGKTTLANVLRQELLDRSVSILWIDRRSADSIDLRTLTSQLLDKDTAEFGADDIEALFEVLTSQPVAGEKRVLIIDDAERLAADALGYLRLLSSIAAAEMPQIVLFADPSLWDAAEPPNRVDVRELITDRRELQLLDENEAKAFATLCMQGSAFGEGALDALVRHGEGLIGRIASLFAIATTIRDGRRQAQLTVAEIDVAAARLDRIEAAAREEPVAQAASRSRRRATLVPALVSLPIILAAATTQYWWSTWQPHLRVRAEPVAKVDTTPPTTIEAVEQRSSEPTPLGEPDQQASPYQAWVSADLLDNAVAAASAQATDAPMARQDPRAEAASWSAEAAAQSATPKPTDHGATPPAKASATAQETAPDREHVPDAEESAVVTINPAPQVVVAVARDRAAVTADQPALPAPATAQTAASEASVPEHVGDVRETPAVRALPVADVRPLLERGGAMLALGDIVAARLLYARAAALGSAEAATSIGKTYDPAFLVSIAAVGTTANPGLAASWYRKAAKLGDLEAAHRLATMTAGR